jgi:predicted GH43/DUF377 family glycosyl hydrolase
MLATAILLTGCDPIGASPSVGPRAAATPASTSAGSAGPATPGPTTAPGPSTEPGPFRLVGEAPVIPRSIVPDRTAILPAAVAFDDGMYHAWIVAFAAIPGTQDIHHLTSPDAVAWSVVEDGSLEALSDGLSDPGAFPTSVFADGDGWVMYYTGVLEPQREGWEVWRATAPGPNGPWTGGEQPVLRRGPAGAWDAGGLDFPSVTRTEDGYLMVYSGVNSLRRETGSIGLATSSDGIAWTKHDEPATTDPRRAESDPVVEPGLCGAFDARAVHQPRLVPEGDRLVLAYAGYAGALDSRASIGLAASQDGGRTWSCAWPSPALDETGLPPGDVHTLVAFPRGERLAVMVEWLTRGGTDVWLTEAEAVP